MQSVPITTEVVSSNLARGEVYSMQHYVINFQCLATGWWYAHKKKVKKQQKIQKDGFALINVLVGFLIFVFLIT